MIHKMLLCLLVLLTPLGIFSQESEEAGKKKEEVKSIYQEWKETLQFGIAEEVLDTLKKIREAREVSLNPQLVILFKESLSVPLKTAILDYFSELKYPGLEATASSIIEEYEDVTRSFATKCIKYLAAIGSKELAAQAKDLLDSSEDEIAIALIQGLGDLAQASMAELLLEKLVDDEYSNKRKPEIILSLGKMKAGIAVPRLIEIVEDKEEEKIWRMYAADSLGKIGDAAAVPAIRKLFSEDDALLRSYAAAALSAFQLADTADVLIQGLKDSNWKVRIQAAKGLANVDSAAAIEILEYKVNKDPVKNVQLEAIRSLGTIGRAECFTFLRELYQDDKKSLELRDGALEMLVAHDLEASLEVMVKVITPELGKKVGKAPIAEATGKRLVGAESSRLEVIYGLFLGSENLLLRIYAIRGAALNKLTSLKESIQAIAADAKAGNLQKEAIAALEKF